MILFSNSTKLINFTISLNVRISEKDSTFGNSKKNIIINNQNENILIPQIIPNRICRKIHAKNTVRAFFIKYFLIRTIYWWNNQNSKSKRDFFPISSFWLFHATRNSHRQSKINCPVFQVYNCKCFFIVSYLNFNVWLVLSKNDAWSLSICACSKKWSSLKQKIVLMKWIMTVLIEFQNGKTTRVQHLLGKREEFLFDLESFTLVNFAFIFLWIVFN